MVLLFFFLFFKEVISIHHQYTAWYSAAGNNWFDWRKLLYCHCYNSIWRWRFVNSSSHFTLWVDFQNPFVNAASVVLLLRLTDGALLPSKAAGSQWLRRLGCGWWRGDVDGWGRALLNATTLWGMISLTIHISAVNCLLVWVKYLSASEDLLSSSTGSWWLSPHWRSVCFTQCFLNCGGIWRGE